jgi:hypothetical protein
VEEGLWGQSVVQLVDANSVGRSAQQQISLVLVLNLRFLAFFWHFSANLPKKNLLKQYKP